MGQVSLTPQGKESHFGLVYEMLAGCSKVVGEAFFPMMVEALAHSLSVRWVFMCVLTPGDPDRAATLAAWDNGPIENFEYDLRHSPCADIVTQGACCFPDNITNLFPQDHLLKEMGAVSYVGTPLRSSSGQILGLLAALDEKPIPHADQAAEILELFSGRAAAELERLATASINERLGRIVEDSVSEVFIFNGDTCRFELVNRGARENLGYSMDELRSLTPWDLKPEFTRDEFLAFVAPLRRGEVPNLLFETVHRRKDGSLYDVAVQLQYFAGVENLFYASINDITERRRAEQARAHLAAIVASSNEAIISTALDGTVRSWNKGAEKIYGYAADEMIGRSVTRLIPADRKDEEDSILARVSKGEMVSNYETVRVCRDGRQVDVSVNVSPIYDTSGRIVGASKIAHDISERKRAEARERLLMGEVNHRAKNMLALVQVIARQTVVSDPTTFQERFDERIQALAASHDVLLQSGWQDVPLHELVRSQLAYFGADVGQRIRLSGPDLHLRAAAAQAFGMALHELATNAAKYGALSNDDGAVEISWQIVDDAAADPVFELVWTECGGPPVTAPARRGFGSTVIERILKLSIDGEVDLDYAPTGLVCRAQCPTRKVLEKHTSGSSLQSRQAAKVDVPGLRGRRVLVVEDEVLIAVEVAEFLKDAGFEILGPVGSVKQAIELLDTEACDVGVLDINLGGETSEPIAEWLGRNGTPFLTLSSYGVNDRSPVFANSPHLDKPLRPAMLVKEIEAILAPAE